MVFAAALGSAVLETPLSPVSQPVWIGAVLASSTAVHVLVLIFLTAVLTVVWHPPQNAAAPEPKGVKQMALAMQHVLEALYGRSVRLVVGWRSLLGHTVGPIAATQCRFWSSALIQLCGTLHGLGAVCMQAAGLSRWPGRPPGSTEHASALASAPVTVRAGAGRLQACRTPILHSRTPRHRQRAAAGCRWSLVIATFIAGAVLATWLRSGASTQVECNAVSKVVGLEVQRQAPAPAPRRAPRGVGLGARRIQPRLGHQGAEPTQHAQPTCVPRHQELIRGSKLDPPRWLLTGGATEVETEGNRGLWLRSRPQLSALVPYRPPAQPPLPTLLTGVLNLLAVCACIANRAATAAAEAEAVAIWSGWQPPLPLLARLRTAGVGSRAPLAAPRGLQRLQRRRRPLRRRRQRRQRQQRHRRRCRRRCRGIQGLPTY